MSRITQNSHDIRRIFAKCVKASKTNIVQTACTNMRAAKHRFESFAKPLGRTCLHLHATIQTALQLTDKPNTAERAKEWLKWLNTERCVMAAMLADASDQSLAITRVMDSENVDPARMHKVLHEFNMAVTALFCDKKCLSIFGYTKVMLRLLRETVVWHVGNDTYSIGDERGVPEDVVERCIQRMASWVILARAALKAEFPSWEIGQA